MSAIDVLKEGADEGVLVMIDAALAEAREETEKKVLLQTKEEVGKAWQFFDNERLRANEAERERDDMKELVRANGEIIRLRGIDIDRLERERDEAREALREYIQANAEFLQNESARERYMAAAYRAKEVLK